MKVDDSDNSMGWKCAEYEMKGVPLRVECGPRDLENGQCILVRRNDGEKTVIKLEELEQAVEAQLAAGARRACTRRQRRIWRSISTRRTPLRKPRSFSRRTAASSRPCGAASEACELKMKEVVGMSSRCMPLKQEHLGDTCACCGKPAKHMIYWGVAY